jgi:microsomal dipeptidase-like Zn-dependent dipeptidase
MSDIEVSDVGRALHREAIIVDFLALYYVLEEKYAERVLSAGVSAVNLTFGGDEGFEPFLRSVDAGLAKIEKSTVLTFATRAADIRKAKQDGRLAIVMGTQGASIVGEELSRLRLLSRLGLRCLGLHGSFANLFGDASAEYRDGGLTLLGRELIDAVNELPLLLDVAHCGHATASEAIARARAPVCSHANSFAVEPTNRNRKDEDIRALAAKGSMIGVCALPRAVKAKDPSIQHMLDHVDHIAKLTGPQHVGLGLDLMEGYRENKTVSPALLRRRTLRPDIFGSMEDFFNDDLPHGMNSIAALPQLTQGLLDRGHPPADVKAILGGNWLRTIETFIG